MTTDRIERVAFLGTGMMGAPMAERLVAAGLEVAVWNRTPSKAAPLEALGARLAATPEEAARNAQALCLRPGRRGGRGGSVRAERRYANAQTRNPGDRLFDDRPEDCA
jgi:3-hydroxyacyl-CoA dehydrogenase